MKKVLVLFLGLSLLFISGSSILSNTKDWGTIRQATYAIGDSSRTFCSATKISEKELLTAAHCMAGSEDGNFVIWNENNIVGQAVVVKTDQSRDLALLSIVSGVEGLYASVASREPLQDTIVVLAGYPLNLGEILTEGALQGSRIDSGTVYYVSTAPGTFGNSGGGLWAYRPWYGWELVGVASSMATQDWYYGPIPFNSVTFHVSLEEIQKFLKEDNETG
jgi:V8-like Glu-specific endopeptidase